MPALYAAPLLAPGENEAGGETGAPAAQESTRPLLGFRKLSGRAAASEDGSARAGWARSGAEHVGRQGGQAAQQDRGRSRARSLPGRPTEHQGAAPTGTTPRVPHAVFTARRHHVGKAQVRLSVLYFI